MVSAKKRNPGKRSTSATPSKKARGDPQTEKPKKKQTQLFNGNDAIRAGLQEANREKRILLKASAIYGKGKIPEGEGEEDYLFQYSIVSINEDCKTAHIEFNEMYTTDDHDHFLNYPITEEDYDAAEQESTIKTYSLTRLRKDHDLYNAHLGRGNKIANDAVAAQQKRAEEEMMKETKGTKDIKAKIEEKCNAYELLLGEFETVGELMNHTIQSGPNKGKVNQKQTWQHKHSGYSFIWHRHRGDKTVLIKKSGATVCDDDAKNYSSVEDMDPLVERYCELYTEDLARRVGMKEKNYRQLSRTKYFST